MTFVSNLMQYKSSNYEVEKAESKITNPTKSYPNSIWYKAFALITLEMSNALNFVNMIGFLFYVFPNSTEAYAHETLEEAFGNSEWL